MAARGHSGFLGRLARFGRDERGVSAVEFALIAPVVITIYFGLVEFCQAYMAQKRMSHATSQVADMVAQAPDITRDEIDDVFAIGGLILSPFSAANFSQRVTSITRDAGGVARVAWSRGAGMTPLSGVQTVPAGLIANGETIIMSESSFRYVSPIRKLLPGTTTFTARHYLRPRVSDTIPCPDC